MQRARGSIEYEPHGKMLERATENISISEIPDVLCVSEASGNGKAARRMRKKNVNELKKTQSR